MGDGYSELGRYILTLIKMQNMSLRQASLKSGLEAGTISKILQRDGLSIPTPETLDKIAAGLGGDHLHMMSLAGHLPLGKGEEADELDDPELYAKMQRLQDLVREIAKRDPDAAARLMGMVITPLEIMLALEEAGEETPEPDREEEAASNGKKVV